ncbi:MAG: acylneuraminate cytidylyltransferase family protein [Methylomonas sp.]|nr:acylneuraminate cytidylyltransferase family protein [Methylomonas sp.]
MNIKTLIVVPARSGSKGLKDKNIRSLGGKPLLAWTVEALKEAKIDNFLAILSTDSERYADIGRELGLVVPFLRPDFLASDTSTSQQFLEHAIAWFDSEYGMLPPQTMLLQPTSPFRAPEVISTALSLMEQRGVDGVVACKEIHRDLTTLFHLENDFLSPLDKERGITTNRQQIQPLLTPNGAIYLSKTHELLKNKSFYSKRTIPLLVTSPIENIDIDTQEDWDMAEALIRAGYPEKKRF